MALELYMVGLIVKDMAASLEFYRRLGLEIPPGSEGKTHVQIKMASGLTLFLDSRPSRWDPAFDEQGEPRPADTSGRYPFLLEFYLKERAAVDAAYQELTGLGYQGQRAPYETRYGMYFAMIKDPDGNTILLSGDLEPSQTPGAA
jgi:catechol 2,3-dioxygenase-like lactoylglutathione lyase family enzyme